MDDFDCASANHHRSPRPTIAVLLVQTVHHDPHDNPWPNPAQLDNNTMHWVCGHRWSNLLRTSNGEPRRLLWFAIKVACEILLFPPGKYPLRRQ